MTRPKRGRRIGFEPEVTYFKPQGIPMRFLHDVDLSLDELEAIRLKYHLNLNNEAGAKKMKISASTFQRLIISALKKIADALINGKALKIHKTIDFNYPFNPKTMPKFDGTGPLGKGPGTGRGLGPCKRAGIASSPEKETLEKQITMMENDLKAARQRLDEINKK